MNDLKEAIQEKSKRLPRHADAAADAGFRLFAQCRGATPQLLVDPDGADDLPDQVNTALDKLSNNNWGPDYALRALRDPALAADITRESLIDGFDDDNYF